MNHATDTLATIDAAGENLLEVRGLVTEFQTRSANFRAVRGVDLTVRKGEAVAIVGESGSGKSVTGLSIMRLIDPPRARIAAGSILLRRQNAVDDLAALDESAMRRIRGGEIAMIFQEPMTSLNPVHTVGRQIAESVRLHLGVGPAEARARAIDMLRLVEIPEPARRAQAYPHQLSGGMRQRVMIAMALACQPQLLIADEPTTALDVTIQAQILALLTRLRGEFGMGIIFITHNLAVVYEFADRVEVMYGGRIVESATVAALFERPRHPYTKALLASAPTPDVAERPRKERPRLRVIGGSPVDPRRLPPGCSFAPRCPLALDACRKSDPRLEWVGESHRSACIRRDEL
jgi:oligopeptide/dipeptide ABC transporter ATP-binding protein